MNNRKLMVLLTSLLMAFAIVACGGGDDEVDTIDTSATVEAGAEGAVDAVDAEVDEAITDTELMTDSDEGVIVSSDASVVTDTNVITGIEVTTQVEVTTNTVAITEDLVTTVVTQTDLITDEETDTESATLTDSDIETDTADLGNTSSEGQVEGAVDVEAVASPTPAIVTDTVVQTATLIVTDTDIVTEEVDLEGGTIVDVAVAAGDFDTLVLAIQQAGLTQELSGAGPYTVFAPTDEAFEALPAGTLDTLLVEPEGDLRDLLLNHVVDGAVLSSDLSDGMEIETLGGSTLTVSVDGNTVTVNGAEITSPDIEAGNGVIHVIDSVITQ